MPYYVYRVKPFAQLEKLAEFSLFAEASRHAKALRAAPGPQVPGRVRVMYAEDERTAADLLCQVREAPPSGDD